MPKHETESELLVCLIRAALQPGPDQTVPWEEGCSPRELAGMILRQSLVTMAYPVICGQTDERWSEVKELLRPAYDREIHRGMIQEYEFRTLLEEMERDGIDCLPLKGWIMREYYPDPLMRSMGDLDVLVREMDSQRMQDWMEGKGYALENNRHPVHDEYKKPPYTCVELHRCLIDTSFLWKLNAGWISELEKRIWSPDSLAGDAKHIHRLRDEDFYLYHLLHFYKHFMYAGSGIRPVLDVFIFLRKKPDLDRGYLDRQLNALHLDPFARKIEDLAAGWFGSGVFGAEEREVLAYLTGSGTYGDRAARQVIQIAGEGKDSLQQSIRSMQKAQALPGLAVMQKRYPRLNRHPWLLPLYWGIRGMRVLLFERQKIGAMQKTQKEALQTIQESEYEQVERVFQMVGINREK